MVPTRYNVVGEGNDNPKPKLVQPKPLYDPNIMIGPRGIGQPPP
jgi:hypothetical protein